RVRIGGRAEADAAALLEAGLAALAEAGSRPELLMRSRLWARDRGCWRIGAGARTRMFRGDLRAASSSYIAAERLSPGIDVALDLVALMAPSAKEVVEYDPTIPPPRFARAAGL